MIKRSCAVLAAACLAVASAPAGAQTWYTKPSSWYVGAAGGSSQFDINCDVGACSRDSGGYKLYGGFRFPNNTGAELMYVDVGSGRADALHHTHLTDARVEGRYWALAGVWAPRFGNGFNASLKLGVAGSDGKTTGVDGGAPGGADRTKFPHVYAGAGLGWQPFEHLTFTADYDYSRISYRNIEDGSDHHLKQTVDAGTVMLGAAWSF